MYTHSFFTFSLSYRGCTCWCFIFSIHFFTFNSSFFHFASSHFLRCVSNSKRHVKLFRVSCSPVFSSIRNAGRPALRVRLNVIHARMNGSRPMPMTYLARPTDKVKVADEDSVTRSKDRGVKDRGVKDQAALRQENQSVVSLCKTEHASTMVESPGDDLDFIIFFHASLYTHCI